MRLVNSLQMRDMDRYTIEEIGVPGIALMENAAKSWILSVESQLINANTVHIFCGAGNNGGDGYAIARNLSNQNIKCQLIAVKPPKSADCVKNAEIWRHYGDSLSWQEYVTHGISPDANDVVIDAILGTGVETDIRGTLVEVIRFVDNLPGIKIAVDIPSGISASTGDLLGVAIKADFTTTFQKEKIGHHLNPGKRYTGVLSCQNISIKEKFPPDSPRVYLNTSLSVRPLLPHRRVDGYKNSFGHLLCWCGSEGTLGASFLAGFSALKIGTGLVTTALPKEFQNTFLTKAPEMMTLPQESVTVNQLKKYDAVVIGCGLGRDKKIWRRALPMLRETEHPILFDADAFYGIDRWETIPLSRSVLTPHPGEFARMSGYAKPKTNRERIDQGVAFIEKYPTTLVLKGAPTLIFDPEGNLFINETGNPGMATAGSGDVLSGIIGGLLAQGLTPSDASLLGVWLHGGSGDSYRDARGEESLTATSLIERLPESIRRLTTTSD